MVIAEKYVAQLIKDNEVMVFSKSYCPYCDKVKQLFEKLKLKFFAIELDKLENGGEIQGALKSLNGQNTVPNVYVKGDHIGGCDDTFEAHKNGSLRELIAY